MQKWFRGLATLLVLAAALLTLWIAYRDHLNNPWTRDGQVRAQVIQITPRVTGVIVNLPITDNTEVKAGDVLFEIDPRPYQAAVAQAQANVDKAAAQLNTARQERDRGLALGQRDPGLLSKINREQLVNSFEAAKAALAEAQASLVQAELNLSFTQITAPADGYITNLNLQLGAHATANAPVVALIDKHSFWVDGFFKETDIAALQPGDQAQVTFMSYPDQPVGGRVHSIGYGISQADGATGNALLQTVNPNFQWIRLAQRLPVRIDLAQVPEGLVLRVGMTASVLVRAGTAQLDKP